jgi:hypothetical protein
MEAYLDRGLHGDQQAIARQIEGVLIRKERLPRELLDPLQPLQGTAMS